MFDETYYCYVFKFKPLLKICNGSSLYLFLLDSSNLFLESFSLLSTGECFILLIHIALKIIDT